jgi:hypothetical protein
LSARLDSNERSHEVLQVFLSLAVLGNLAGLALVVAALLTEPSAKLSGAQLLSTGAVAWLTNVVVFGLWFWTLDCGGPVKRAQLGRARPDFQFPQDDDPQLARGDPWYPRLEDYVYVAFTNGFAFSPTDTMPLTRWAKGLMAWHSLMSVIALLLIAARAVNVLGG